MMNIPSPASFNFYQEVLLALHCVPGEVWRESVYDKNIMQAVDALLDAAEDIPTGLLTGD